MNADLRMFKLVIGLRSIIFTVKKIHNFMNFFNARLKNILEIQVIAQLFAVIGFLTRCLNFIQSRMFELFLSRYINIVMWICADDSEIAESK